MGSGVSPYDGVPKEDASLGSFVEQAAGGDDVVTESVESDDSCSVKRVTGEMSLENYGVELFGS